MTPWQRRLRAAIAIFGLGVAVAVVIAIRQPRSAPPAATSVDRVDPASALEGTSGQMFRLRGESLDVSVEYDRLATYADGRQRFMGVRVHLPRRQGRDVVIAADEALVAGADQSHIELTGHVDLQGSDGLRMAGDLAVFSKSDGVVDVKGPVTFSRGRLSGSSVDATYREGEARIELHRNAVIRFAPERPNEPALDITAGSAVFPRLEHYIQFEGGFRLVHGPRVLESVAATAFLTDDESRVQLLEMLGQARLSGLGDGPSAVRTMTARDVSLEFASDGRTLARATLSGDAVIDIAAGAGAARQIAGGSIALGLAPDGATLTSLTARESVRLVLPGDAGGLGRTITAANLVANGAPDTGITAAVFSGDVVFREESTARGAPPTSRIARSRTLDLAVAPGFGEVARAVFKGAVRFEDGRVRVTGAEAQYQVAEGVLDVLGADEVTAQPPRIVDDQVSIDAQTIRLTLEGQRIQASTGVRSTLRPVGASGDAAKRPSMLKADQAVYAASDTLDYDGTSHLAVYAGNARLWQGDTAIQGDRISLDDSTGNLTAGGHARSTFMLDQRNRETARIERVASIGTADHFLYEESSRRATYSGAARVYGPQGDLKAVRIELYLRPSGRELDRAEAYDQVDLHVTDRKASGQRLTYVAADEKYLMHGAPVKIVGECRETEGRSLTFFKGVDTISVNGDDEIRTQTKGGPECWAPRK